MLKLSSMSKKARATLLMSVLLRGESFTPIKTGWMSSPRGEFFFFFFSFLAVSTIRALTTHKVEFTPGRMFSCKQALSFNYFRLLLSKILTES